MNSLRLPRGSNDFRQFVEGWPVFRRDLQRVKENYEQTIARVNEFCAGKELSAKLREAVDAGQSQQFFDRIAELGFRVNESEKAAIIHGLEFQERVSWAFAQLKTAPVRTGWNRKFQEEFSPGAALISCASSPGRIAWVQKTLDESGLGKKFDSEKFRQIAVENREREKVLGAAQKLLGRYGTTVKFGERTLWLIVVSFLVCVVGIANAMLMSVLERFKEIATMKCLGARNQAIAFLFVTESLIIGVVGGIAGTLLGFLIVFIRQGISYGGLLWANIPYGDMGMSFLVCFCCSLLLAVVAAIYPARIAARMAPMEAMRVD
jgi:putative ABC transport system permease protein